VGQKSHARGLCVAFLGIDGSAKSTLLPRLADAPPEWTTGVSVRHLSPLKVRRQGNNTDPHSAPPRGLATSLLKSAYWLFEYLAGYRKNVAPELADGRLVLFDRYLVDALIDPRRYRYGAPAWVLRLVWRLVPKPDLIVFLDAPVEILRARKQEVNPQTMERLRALYLAFIETEVRGRVADVSGSVEEALANVLNLLTVESIAMRALSRSSR
jgi:thymidylate kinase